MSGAQPKWTYPCRGVSFRVVRRVLGLGLLGAVLLGGCYGSTEPATKIRPDSAQLNGRGTADDGPAFSFFRVQRYGVPLGDPVDTPTRQWPAGASGPITEQLTGLAEATDYLFKLCGGNAGDEAACANTKSFATRGPDGQDSVLGAWRIRASADPSGGVVRARSDPSGANPRGSLEITQVLENVHVFKGFVSCVRVKGNQATVGAIGLDKDQNGNDQPSTAKMSIVDPGLNDGFSYEVKPGSTPPDCGAAFPAVNGALISTIVVTDN
jgi:hypothetical protein